VAELVVIDGQSYKERSPTGVRLLTMVTLTVYWYVWYYKINDEARRYLQDESIKPWMSVVAIFPGFVLLFIPVLISAYRTGRRIERMEKQAVVTKTVRPAIGFLLFFLTIITLMLLLGGGAYYYQTHLNTMWTTTKASSHLETPDASGPTPVASIRWCKRSRA
jgi:H+/Cl- antiporter ClcA